MAKEHAGLGVKARDGCHLAVGEPEIENVQVLNGGLQMAKAKGLTVNANKVEAKTAEKISLKEWKLPKVDLNFIQKHSEEPDYLVIDVREKDR